MRSNVCKNDNEHRRTPQKLKVAGYKDDKFTQKVGDGRIYQCLLNPEKYTL